jgi:hypothetical protein
MKKLFIVTVNNKRIGYTEFEYADPPMGVVHGKIIFDDLPSPYEFFRTHCIHNHVQINSDEPEERLIDTQVIPQLRVLLENGEELKGWGGAITGMDSDVFEIQFGGVSSELMQTEFENHYNEYYGKN